MQYGYFSNPVKMVLLFLMFCAIIAGRSIFHAILGGDIMEKLALFIALKLFFRKRG